MNETKYEEIMRDENELMRMAEESQRKIVRLQAQETGIFGKLLYHNELAHEREIALTYYRKIAQKQQQLIGYLQSLNNALAEETAAIQQRNHNLVREQETLERYIRQVSDFIARSKL